MVIRVGTRGSALARWQANWVAEHLRRSGAEVEMVPITTLGDRESDAIGTLSGRGVFTREIQLALLDRRIDLAVHSLKDLPTERVPGLCLAAVPERASPNDALICRAVQSLRDLPDGAAVGTGSLRRRAQLLHVRPDLRMKDIRGNVDTRLAKLQEGRYDAIVLAEAGLRRLAQDDVITQILPTPLLMPAPGQGALGLETREDDAEMRQSLTRLDHRPSRHAVLAERAMLATLQGGCLAPIAARARAEDSRLVLTGRVISPDGEQMIENTQFIPQSSAEAAVSLGRRVASSLLNQGAAEVIKALRPSPPNDH